MEMYHIFFEEKDTNAWSGVTNPGDTTPQNINLWLGIKDDYSLRLPIQTFPRKFWAD